MSDDKKKTPVALRLDPELVQQLKDAAEGVPLATYIALVLRRHVKDLADRGGA